MIVFDRSGSMALDAGTGRSKIDEARDAASLFVQLVQSDGASQIGLVSFSTAASNPVDFALQPVNAVNKQALTGPTPFTTGIIGGLVAGGSTSIGGGLDAARAQIPVLISNLRSILLLTDGLQNTPPLIADVAQSLAEREVEFAPLLFLERRLRQDQPWRRHVRQDGDGFDAV